MEVKAVRKLAVFDRLGGQGQGNQVCSYGLKGRYSRNQDTYLHEVPTYGTEQPPHPRKWTWRNPEYGNTKNAIASTGKGRKFNGANNRCSQKNATADMSQQKVLTVERPHTVRRALQKQSKIPLNGRGVDSNCANNLNIQKRDSAKSSQQKYSTIDERAEPEKNYVHRAQCKFWIAGNCARGDDCKFLHSWFSGSGFTMVAKLKGHSKAVTGIAFQSGSDKLFSVAKDKFIHAWDCHSGQCAASIDLGVEVGCLITEGPWLFAGLTNAVKVWNLQNQAEFFLDGPVGQVHCMVIDGDMLFAGIEDGTILVWKNQEPNVFVPFAILKEHKGSVCSLVIGANRRLYSGSRDSAIKVWDIENMRCMQTLYGHESNVTSVLCWDNYLLSASLDNTLKIWATTESRAINVVYEIKDDHAVIALCGIHDAEEKPILICSYSDSTVRLYDLPSFAERGRIFSKREVNTIQIGVDGLFFTGDATGEVSVWKLLDPTSSTPSKSTCPASQI